MLIDTHAHLDFPTSSVRLQFDFAHCGRWGLRGTSIYDLNDVLKRAKEAGVNKIICVGTSVETSKKSAELAEKFSDAELRIYATVGIHAQDGMDDVKRFGSLEKCIDELRDSIASLRSLQNDAGKGRNDRRVVAIGECGYDFYLDDEKRIKQVNKDRNFQKRLFKAQIELAAELKLPLIIHCRNAWDETFDLLSNYSSSDPAFSLKGRGSREVTLRANNNNSSSGKFSLRSNNNLCGVFHSWTGDWAAAKKALNLGFYISFSGIVTFGNALDVQEVARKMPIARMLLETDSPFLSPEPVRGSPNEPKNVKIVGKFIADIRSQPLDLIASATTANAEALFKL